MLVPVPVIVLVVVLMIIVLMSMNVRVLRRAFFAVVVTACLSLSLKFLADPYSQHIRPGEHSRSESVADTLYGHGGALELSQSAQYGRAGRRH